MMATLVGDLIRFRCQVREGFRFDEEALAQDGTLTILDHGTIVDREETGIVEEVRDDGLFVKDAPQNLGSVGNGQYMSRTHYQLVPYDRVLSVTPALR
jgi:hypothetical protein